MQKTNRVISKLTNNYIEAEKDAEFILDLLAQYNIFEPPVPTGIIVKVVPHTTIDVIDFSTEAFGFSFADSGKWRILINDNLPLGAKRFTAFHELYHILKGKMGFSKDTPEGKLEETKADYFAACILMPARWFRKYWEKTRSIEEMGEIFGVSHKAVSTRLKNLDHYLRANKY